MRDKAGFFKKILNAPKTGEKGPKWANNEVFSIFQKFVSPSLYHLHEGSDNSSKKKHW